MEPLEALFVGFSRRKLAQLGSRIDDCLQRLSEEQIWWRPNEQTNSAGNLVLHLCGNLQQWLGYGVAGEPNTRNRDAEFAARGGTDGASLRRQLQEALARADTIVASLTAPRLAESIVVQGYPVSVLEAVYHVVEHFAQHTAQIIFITKQLTGADLGYYGHLSRPTHHETAP